jgi:hypothetical protein
LVSSDGKEKLAELYEAIPIFLRESPNQKPSTISFQVGEKWVEASPEVKEVRAIKVERFSGAVLITFAKPVRAKLSPEVWTDGFQTQAQCRTVLVDLIKGDARPAAVRSATVEYKIAPAPRTSGVP